MNAHRNWNWVESPGEMLVSDGQWQLIGEILQLTPREYEVCQLLFCGRTRKEIAEELGVSFSTIRQYCEQLHSKLRVTNRVDFVLRVIQVRDFIIRVDERMMDSINGPENPPSQNQE